MTTPQEIAKYLDTCPVLADALRNATTFRMPVEPQPETDPSGDEYLDVIVDKAVRIHLLRNAPYQPGDVIGVREPWVRQGEQRRGTPHKLAYLCDLDPSRPGYPYSGEVHTPSTMPDWAIRTKLVVKDVRAERLHVLCDEETRNYMSVEYEGLPVLKGGAGGQTVEDCVGRARAATLNYYANWWNSRRTPDGTLYAEAYPFGSNPMTYLYTCRKMGDGDE